jgi:hypothetical protein
MNRVLIIAFEFPPLGTGGVLRLAKYVKYLGQFGWEPVVITIDDNESSTGTTDDALLKELPEGTEIHRTPCPDFDALFEKEVQSSMLLKIFRSLDQQFPGVFGFAKPDKHVSWFPFALEKAFQQGRPHQRLPFEQDIESTKAGIRSAECDSRSIRRGCISRGRRSVHG